MAPADIPQTITNDTLPQTETSVATDTIPIRMSKDTLDAPVHYEAADSAVLFVKDQMMILYGETKTTYKDIVLTAPEVELNQQTNILTARAERDSLGRVVTRTLFEQGEQKFENDSIRFNFKTQRGITTNTYTQEGEMFIKANTAKKINNNTLFIKEGYYTTCNLDDPHFAFKSNKLKIINDKLAVSGPTHPEFEGVPIPIYLPFGIYPLSQGRHSGLLPPQFTANEQFGVGLEGLGYYHVLNDFYDVTVRGDIYSYGGWSFRLTPTYRKRYRFNGAFNIAFQHTKFAFKGDPDYRLSKTFQVSWNHSVDSRARPGTTFSANVNAGSTSFNELVPGNAIRNITNQMYSSISYSKQWQGKPFSLQLAANHNQNNQSKQIYITLPDVGFAITTQYPFQRKEMIGAPKWYEKIGIGYNGVFRNQVAFVDTGKVSIANIMDTLQWGARHSFPINMQLPSIAGKVFVSPGISYEETWLTERIQRQWNAADRKVDTINHQKGLFIDRQMSFSLNLNTNVFGFFEFKKSTVRHVIRPTIGFSYRPNLSAKYFDVIQLDSGGYRQALPQLVQHAGFNGYGYGKFGGLTFVIDNNLEMKRKNREDSAAAEKKIKLIDGFTISTAYNFLQDTQRLTPVNMSLRSTLFEKVSITASAMLDPYAVGPTGRTINRFAWQDGKFSLGRLTYGQISMSTSFQGGQKGGAGPALQPGGASRISDPTLLGDQQRLAEYMNRNPAEFVDFSIPWSINLSYALSFTRRFNRDYSGFQTDINSNISFSPSFSLTPQWKFSTNGYFDFNTGQMTMFTLSINRDLHCWQMGINITPIGNYRYFNITINPKSTLLQDLKVNRTRYFYNY
ncbi:MAG: putative LPS assembly protein LptD [Flavisolibacter sp.]